MNEQEIKRLKMGDKGAKNDAHISHLFFLKEEKKLCIYFGKWTRSADERENPKMVNGEKRIATHYLMSYSTVQQSRKFQLIGGMCHLGSCHIAHKVVHTICLLACSRSVFECHKRAGNNNALFYVVRRFEWGRQQRNYIRKIALF